MNSTRSEEDKVGSAGDNLNRRIRKRRRAAVFSIVATILFLAMVEGLLAIVGVETGKDVQGAKDAFTKAELRIAKEIDRELRKLGASAYRIKGTVLYLYKPYKSKYYNANSMGFRGKEVKAKRDGDYRIMVMGGSTVYGQRVADDATIPAYLEASLRATYPARSIAVFNLGIEGYVFQREIALARHLEPRLQPDLILFYHGYNDLEYAYANGYCRPMPFEAKGETHFAGPVTLGSKVRHVLYRSRIIQILRPPLRRILRSKNKRTDAQLRQNADSFVRGYVRDAKAVKDELLRKSIDVLFLVQPTVFFKNARPKAELKMAHILATSAHGPGFHDFYKRCAERLVQLDVAEDLTHAFDDCEGQVYWDTIHLNPVGNEIVAKRLSEILADKDLIEKTSQASERDAFSGQRKPLGRDRQEQESHFAGW